MKIKLIALTILLMCCNLIIVAQWRFPLNERNVSDLTSAFELRDKSNTGYDYDFHGGMDLAKWTYKIG